MTSTVTLNIRAARASLAHAEQALRNVRTERRRLLAVEPLAEFSHGLSTAKRQWLDLQARESVVVQSIESARIRLEALEAKRAKLAAGALKWKRRKLAYQRAALSRARAT